MKIFIIGCGGTGSNLIKELARYLSTSHLSDIAVTLIDGDVVEEKNLERQAFQESDCKINKAEAMAKAVAEVFDVEFQYYPHYIEDKEQLKSIIDDHEPEDFSVIIGAVDNHYCRMVMHQVFSETASISYIDSANEYEGGEVVVATKFNGVELFPDKTYYFPEILAGENKSVTEMSCEELNNSSPQHIVTNLMAANICLAQLLHIINGEFNYGGIYIFNALNSLCKREVE